MRIVFVVPGDINQPTGGYRYDRRITDEWRKSGIDVSVLELAGSFPFPKPDERETALCKIIEIEEGSTVVVDGLAGGAMPELFRALSQRATVFALIHHPLCLETGLTEAAKAQLRASEQEGLEHLEGVITTSTETARAVSRIFGYPGNRIETVVPGVDRGKTVAETGNDVIRLLCTGSVIERKGHLHLVNALSSLKDLSWRLDCIGNCGLEHAYFNQVSKAVEQHGFNDRITFHGAVEEETLEAAYAMADIFVLPSMYEGYGMAYAEAIVRGVPVIGTTAGAIPGTVPKSCGLLVEPGNTDQLAGALRLLIEDTNARERLREGALAAEPVFPTWTQSAGLFLEKLGYPE